MIEEHPFISYILAVIVILAIGFAIVSAISNIDTGYSSTPKYKTECLEMGYDNSGNFRCLRVKIIN